MSKTLELNIPAKQAYNKMRRRDMATWRKHKVLFFNNQMDFIKWLEYTGWWKRPVNKVYEGLQFKVTFLDNMKGAK